MYATQDRRSLNVREKKVTETSKPFFDTDAKKKERLCSKREKLE